LLPGEQADALSDNAFLFEEFLLREHQAARLPLKLKPLPQKQALGARALSSESVCCDGVGS
jgi:hypothetical protein